MSKTYLILGLARSGQSALTYLKNKGHTVLCYDDNPEKNAQFGGIQNRQQIPFENLTAVIQSPGVAYSFPEPHPITAQAQKLNIPIMTDINLFQEAYPTISYVGVTGTNGKSTTTALAGHILQATVGGNIGIPVLDTAPEKQCVLELSSYQLERSQPILLETAAWINISEDHLDHHGTMAEYVKAKERIFEKAQKAVIGIDDDFSKNVYAKIKQHMPTLSVSVQTKADIWVKNGILYDDVNPIIDLNTIRSLQGAHNHQNAAIAYGVAKTMGLAPQQIQDRLQTFPGLVHRQEHVLQKGAVTFINDSKATNADATYWALKAFDGKTIIWIAGGIPKTQGIEPLKAFFPKVHHTFLIGTAQNNFSTILQGYPHTLASTLEKAVQNAYIMAKSLNEEVIILFSPACASFDQFQDFEHRGNVFKKIVMDLK